jgi:hypothetical protein
VAKWSVDGKLDSSLIGPTFEGLRWFGNLVWHQKVMTCSSWTERVPLGNSAWKGSGNPLKIKY